MSFKEQFSPELLKYTKYKRVFLLAIFKQFFCLFPVYKCCDLFLTIKYCFCINTLWNTNQHFFCNNKCFLYLEFRLTFTMQIVGKSSGIKYIMYTHRNKMCNTHTFWFGRKLYTFSKDVYYTWLCEFNDRIYELFALHPDQQ